ncbi:hypothetical protein ES707_11665 [subsurface metagenome]
MAAAGVAAGIAIISFITSLFTSLKSSKDAEAALKEQQEYLASQSYASAVRSVELQREQRQLSAELATSSKAYSETVEDLQTQMVTAMENAELVTGSDPVFKKLPVEKILLPVVIAIIVKQVFR